MDKYRTIIRAKLELSDSTPSEKTIQAVAKKLEQRGKFPVGLVSQPDILALRSVILTTGRPGNLNDDVMLNEEILPVLHTAALKPFNVEHSKVVIGTIFDAFAVNKETGEVLPSIESFDENMSEKEREEQREMLLSTIKDMPENIDIITNQVLWALHFPDLVANIKEKAILGEMFVSMELWFTDFDFLVGNKIIKRTPETAMILDDKLRINGGTGFLGLDRVKRVPRNVVFAGNAAVETPANPESFILDVMDRNDLMDQQELVEEEQSESVTASVADTLNANTISVLPSLRDGGKADKQDVVGDVGRSDTPLGSNASVNSAEAEVDEVVNQNEDIMEGKEKVVELVERNAVLTSENDKLTRELVEASKANDELQSRNAELEAKLEEHLASIKEHEDELAAKIEAANTLEAEKVELESKLEEVNAKLAEIEEARKLEARTLQLKEIGLSDERIARTVAKTSELDDEAFAVEVEDLKAFISEFATNEIVEDSVEDSASVEDNSSEDEGTEANVEEVLEEIEEEDTPVADAIASLPETDDSVEEEVVYQNIFAKAMGVRLGARK